MIDTDKHFMISEIEKNFNIRIKRAIPFKGCFKIFAGNNNLFVKKTQLSPQRLMFVHGAKEHLFNNGFKNQYRYILNKDGIPSISINSSNYVVTSSHEGTECDFEKEIDVISASRILAKMHKCSKGYNPLTESHVKDMLGIVPKQYEKRLTEMKKLKKMAEKERRNFDYLFLKYYDYFFEVGLKCLSDLENSEYDRLVQKAKKEKSFCHHDYTHQNIIIRDNNYYILNFENCCFDLKIYDIANLIRRKMRKCNWDIGQARKILDSYTSVQSLSRQEIEVLKIILEFPQKFYRVCNKYYNSKRSWAQRGFLNRLNESIHEIESHKDFMDKFDYII